MSLIRRGIPRPHKLTTESEVGRFTRRLRRQLNSMTSRRFFVNLDVKSVAPENVDMLDRSKLLMRGK